MQEHTLSQPGEVKGKICIGAISGVHGVKGLVKLQSFAENPRAFSEYGPLADEAGMLVKLEVLSALKGQYLAKIDGINDRTAAEAIKGKRLYIDRAALPEPTAGEYYHADLIGLTAIKADGAILGNVAAVHNYGAGDVLEIRQGKQEIFLPFVKSFVPEVDIAAGRLTIADYTETE
jgi:16S rRNA processing protein RimM